jgi:hypothetical protein
MVCFYEFGIVFLAIAFAFTPEVLSLCVGLRHERASMNSIFIKVIVIQEMPRCTCIYLLRRAVGALSRSKRREDE